MPKYIVRDSITFDREWEVFATDEDAAIEAVGTLGLGKKISEEQVDSQPYEVEEMEPTCARCGEEARLHEGYCVNCA